MRAGDMNVATAFCWTGIIISACLTGLHVSEYYVFLDPAELWAYNYCMHLPFVELHRHSKV